MGEEHSWGPKTLAFFAALRTYPNVSAAAKAAGVSRRAHYQRLERNPRYKAAFLEVYSQGIEALEDEAVRRAMGIGRPLVYHGVPVVDEEGKPVMTMEYSDTLMLALLKAKKPDVYSERVKQEIAGEGGGPVKLEVVFVRPGDKG